MRLGLGALAAVAAGQQGQGREHPGQRAQSRFHKRGPVAGGDENSPLSFVWLLVFARRAAILATRSCRPKRP
ncbi:hypothetical protein F7234_19785 [Pseudomonas putida]|nr:hypothetical protein F7234_19785 [Pseudomonas putida]